MPGYVFGGSATVEPEGFELESRSWREPCPKCPAQAFGWRIENNDGGCINIYRGLRCNPRGHFEGTLPGDP